MTNFVVDAHAHVFRPARIFPRAVDELAPANRDAPVEDLLERMASAGVDAAVLVPLSPDDEYVARILHEAPRSFAAIAVAAPGELQADGRSGLDHLIARRASYAFHGVRTQWLGEPGEPIEASPAFPVMRYLAEEGLVLWSYLPREQLPLLVELVTCLPALRVVVNHLGLCPNSMMIDEHKRPYFERPVTEFSVQLVTLLADFPNVYLMVSGQYAVSRCAPPYRDIMPLMRRLTGAYAPQRMLWGSDYPWTREVPGYSSLLTMVKEATPGLDTDDLAWVIGGTAHELFPHLGKDFDE